MEWTAVLSAACSRNIQPLESVTISSASSCGGLNATDSQDSYKKQRADFQSLASALQSGDLSSAQQAFAQLQQDNPRLANALNSASSDSDSTRLTDLKSLSSALQSGDVSGAQQAMAQLQQDGQTAQVGGHHHHHHHAATASDPTAAASTDNSDTSIGSLGSTLNVSA
jgi:DNA-binding FadR family transcriptional regulator